MKVVETPLVDASVITVDKYEDERGFFMESFNQEQFVKELGHYDFVQENYCEKITFLHFQLIDLSIEEQLPKSNLHFHI